MRALLSLLLLLTLIPAAAEVYRWTDDKGVIHYGDKAPADNVKPVQLPPLQTYSPSTPPRPAATSSGTAPAAVDSAPPKIRIASPTQDETVRDAEQRLSVAVDVELQPAQGLLYFLDGSQQNKLPTVSMAYLMENVERGEHIITAAVVSADGKLLSRSEPVTVHIKPPIAQPPPPPPKPRPASR